MTLTDKKTGVVKRNIKLPKKVIPTESTAKFENGVLKVEISKLEKEDTESILNKYFNIHFKLFSKFYMSLM